MTVLEAIILGIVEGITEYLPVSSTGHLIVTQYLLGMKSSTAMNAFSVCIQGGAIIAVAGLYFQRVKQMIMGLFGKDAVGLRLLINIILAFTPAVVIALLFGKMIKAYLFSAQTVAWAWLIGGVVILLFTRWNKRRQAKQFEGQQITADSGKSVEELTWKQALAIGLMQCIAMCPGVSRSLTTMLGGIITGLSLKASVEFSFLLGLVTLSAASAHDAWEHGGEMVQELGVMPIVVGTAVAWLSAVVAVRWLVGYLQKHSLDIFGWYRIAAAIVMFILIFQGAQMID